MGRLKHRPCSHDAYGRPVRNRGDGGSGGAGTLTAPVSPQAGAAGYLFTTVVPAPENLLL